MTVAELQDKLSQFDADEQVTPDMVLNDVEYIFDALEQWSSLAAMFGRGNPEVDRFLQQVCL
jgi:hypothetical protein